MKNLLDETIAVLEKNGKTISDIVAIQGNDFAISINNFIEIASCTNYDSGYGSQEIACDLKIIGNNWWLERREYDGAEWWEFCQFPSLKIDIKEIHTLSGDGWSSLERMQ